MLHNSRGTLYSICTPPFPNGTVPWSCLRLPAFPFCTSLLFNGILSVPLVSSSPGLRLCLFSLYQILLLGNPEQLLLTKVGVTNTAKCCLEWGKSDQQLRIPGKQEEWLFACASAWNAFLTYSHSRPSSRVRFPRKLLRKS